MGEIAIVTGYTGTAHVKSMHDRSRIAGMAGAGTYVLSTGKKLKAEMQNANTVRILDGDLVMQGCHATIEAGTYQELKIDNGTQGQKRNDLVVARYERRAQDPKTESVTLKIVKGTPAATPKDPDVVAGDILGGDLVAEVALWRVPLDGLNVGAPVALFDVLMPMSELRDSISHKLDASKIVFANDACELTVNSWDSGMQLDVKNNGGKVYNLVFSVDGFMYWEDGVRKWWIRP